MGTIARAPEALSIFRQLLRTRKKCFAGDTEMMAAVAEQIRGEFEANRSVTEGQKLEQLLTKAREAVEFMQVSIVQAKLNERGNYGELFFRLKVSAFQMLGHCKNEPRRSS